MLKRLTCDQLIISVDKLRMTFGLYRSPKDKWKVLEAAFVLQIQAQPGPATSCNHQKPISHYITFVSKNNCPKAFDNILKFQNVLDWRNPERLKQTHTHTRSQCKNGTNSLTLKINSSVFLLHVALLHLAFSRGTNYGALAESITLRSFQYQWNIRAQRRMDRTLLNIYFVLLVQVISG